MSTKKSKRNSIKKRQTTRFAKSINKIRAHENRYTFILVVIFIALFGWIGYSAFGIKGADVSLKETTDDNYVQLSTVSSSRVITLTEKDILSNEKGLEKEGYKFDLQNMSPDNMKYIIHLVRDEDISKECGCLDRSVSFKNIRFSIDGEHVNSFMNEDMVIDKGVLNHNSSNSLNLRIWIDEKYKNKNYHFHGHIDVEKIKE